MASLFSVDKNSQCTRFLSDVRTIKDDPRLCPRLTSDSFHSSVYIHYRDIFKTCLSASSDSLFPALFTGGCVFIYPRLLGVMAWVGKSGFSRVPRAEKPINVWTFRTNFFIPGTPNLEITTVS